MASRAVEKLQALIPEAEYAATGKHPTEHRLWPWTRPNSPLPEIVAVLPEIVDVLEAASAWADDSADLKSIEAGEVPSNSELLYFALVALDEALGDDVT